MIEIELKCALSPPLVEKVHQKIRQMPFKGTVQNDDIYYDTPTWDFLRRAVFVRVRNGRTVEFKFNEDLTQAHGLVNERAFPLPFSPAEGEKMNALFAYFLPTWIPAPSFEEVVNANRLMERVRIENTREAYADEHIHLSIDHVKGLGDFLEVETRCEEETGISEAQARLQACVSDLHVQHIHVGYVELWLFQHHPEAYQAGRYHL